MPAKRVHWADEEEGPAFVPPPTPWTPPLMLTTTDDSLTESPPPPTPQSASGNLQRQDFPTAGYDDSSTACASTFSPTTQLIPDHHVPVIPTSTPENAQHLPLVNFDILSLFRPPSTSRHSPQRNQIVLNRYLEYNTEAPLLAWDMCEEPSSSTVRLAGNMSIPDVLLEAPATNPPVQEMYIQCIWHAGWQPLTIRTPTTLNSASPGPPQCITVVMVIKEVYKYLHRRVTGAEYTRFGAIPGEQDAVARAFYARCDRFTRQSSLTRRLVRDRVELETQSGLKRLDSLRGNTMFLGLSSSEEEEGLWYLHCGLATWLPEQS